MEHSVIQEKMEAIKRNEAVNSIILVGSSVKQELTHDVDLFIILNDQGEFIREVTTFKGVNFDISFMPLELLQKGIEKRWPFLITSFVHYKILYQTDYDIESVIRRLKQTDPFTLSKVETSYIRFQLYQDYLSIERRIDDKVNALFLIHDLLAKCLRYYFELQNKWIPRDKKILPEINKIDETLYFKIHRLIISSDVNEKLALLKDIIVSILAPFGGFLTHWDKGKFPLK